MLRPSKRGKGTLFMNKLIKSSIAVAISSLLVVGGATTGHAYGTVDNRTCFVDVELVERGDSFAAKVTGSAACGKYKMQGRELTVILRKNSGKARILKKSIETNRFGDFKFAVKNVKLGYYKLEVKFKKQTQRAVFVTPKR